jgi:hypothetical protein
VFQSELLWVLPIESFVGEIPECLIDIEGPVGIEKVGGKFDRFSSLGCLPRVVEVGSV